MAKCFQKDMLMETLHNRFVFINIFRGAKIIFLCYYIFILRKLFLAICFFGFLGIVVVCESSYTIFKPFLFQLYLFLLIVDESDMHVFRTLKAPIGGQKSALICIQQN